MSTPEKTFLERDQFTVDIQCPKCGQKGQSVWEENHFTSPQGPQPCLLSLSDGFYERVGRKSPYEIELVCHRCGTVQPD